MPYAVEVPVFGLMGLGRNDMHCCVRSRRLGFVHYIRNSAITLLDKITGMHACCVLLESVTHLFTA